MALSAHIVCLLRAWGRSVVAVNSEIFLWVELEDARWKPDRPTHGTDDVGFDDVFVFEVCRQGIGRVIPTHDVAEANRLPLRIRDRRALMASDSELLQASKELPERGWLSKGQSQRSVR